MGYDRILLSRREFVPLGCVAVIQPVYYPRLFVWHLPVSVTSHLTKTSVCEGSKARLFFLKVSRGPSGGLVLRIVLCSGYSLRKSKSNTLANHLTI